MVQIHPPVLIKEMIQEIIDWMSGKCKYWKICKQYRKHDLVCNESRGYYYGLGRPAGCYRSFQNTTDLLKIINKK